MSTATPTHSSSINTGEISIDDRVLAEEQIFLARNRKSQELYERAMKSMPGGVTSSWSSTRPIPVWIDRGQGSHVWDADGNEYVDYHAGYGVNVVGHANPAVVAAVQRRVTMGTHFAQPVEDAIVVAEALAARFGLPQWRFNNSGTESTMDAIHLMRAITGRDLIIKVEGTYHGHHDLVHVSLWRSIADLGPIEDPSRVPGPGIPQVIADLVRSVPVNDLAAVERVFAEHPGQIAGMILEPMMMNAGIIPPEPGYLEGLRELTRKHDALLTFDEVKTGMVVAWGGATELFGVTPDIVCLAKALGGGVPCGAVGGTDEVMSAIADGRYDQVGTFNVNPLGAWHMSTNEANDDGERGVMINTASIAAFEGQIGQVAYTASKAAVAGMTLTMARDLGSLGIRVNTIAPSLFATGLTAGVSDERAENLVKDAAFPRRMGRPDEYARLAIAIIENPMLNGDTIRLDGGQRFAPR